MKTSKASLNTKFTKLTQKASKLFGMLFIALGYYMLGPFLHSETWQEVKFRLKGIREKYISH